MRENIKRLNRCVISVLRWGFFSAVMGVVGGLTGAGFHHTLQFVTGVRQSYNWIVFLLPIGGLLTVFLYHFLKMQSNRGTDEVIDCVLKGKSVSVKVAPAVFAATAITQLFGGSAGREGAALQIGGSVASLLNKIFRLKNEEGTVLIICGMGAVFSGLFGTPLAACLFVVEFESVGTVFLPALLPCFISALLASGISFALGVHKIETVQSQVLAFNFDNTWRIILLAVMIALLSIAMCYVFHKAGLLALRWFSCPYIRILAGATVVVALTLLVGDQRFNGAGMDMALSAINDGSVNGYSFVLKILFTAVTLAAGFKGGEIVPTFCIGATFGCVVGGLLGIDPCIAAMLGLIGLFCAVTNCPLASMALSVELFGTNNLYAFVLTCVIAFAFSGNDGLYKSQVNRFSKHSIEITKDLNAANNE